MRALGATAHFRTDIGSEWRSEGFKGGYCWFLGRFNEWQEFVAAIDECLAENQCSLIELEDQREFENLSDFEDPTARELFNNLADYPLQYRNWHLYKNDDA